MKQGFVYMWLSMSDGKKYIGSHYGDPFDGYVSSSKYFNEIYNKNPKNFIRTILFFNLTRDEALKKEQDLLKDANAAQSMEYYNLHNTVGKGWSHHQDTELSKIYYERISKSKKGKEAHNKGKEIWKDKRYKLRIDTWLIKDPDGNMFEIENMLEFCKLHNLNPSAMSAVARGRRRVYKNYWCKKITNNRNVDYHYKEWESKGHASKANYGAANGHSKSVTLNGITYGCMREASLATGLSMYKLRKLRNKND